MIKVVIFPLFELCRLGRTTPPPICAPGTWSARVRAVYCMENRHDKLYL